MSGVLELGGQSVLFVGGKGGVGKTTTAAGLAVHLAQAGDRVLLVSTDPAHSLGDLFDERIGDRETELLGPTPAGGTLVALEIDPRAEVDAYLDRVKDHMRGFTRPAMYDEIERQLELARHSPGATEAALMDRVAELVHEGPERFDRVIFDTAPTGHTLRLLALPELMLAWTDGMLRSRDRSDTAGEGLRRLKKRKRDRDREAADEPRGDDLSWFDDPGPEDTDPRAHRIREVLLERRRRFLRARRRMLDPAATAFVLVLTPERLPILESRNALAALREHGVPVAGVVVNRVLPADATGDFLDERRRREAEYLEWIDREFGELPRVRVPLETGDIEGTEALGRVGGRLVG